MAAAMDVDGAADQRLALPGFKHEYQDFVLRTQTFTQQFAHMYYRRLDVLKKRLEPEATARWPAVPQVRLLDAREEPCVIIGTLFKQMAKKPDFLKEYTAVESGDAEATGVDPTAVKESYVGDGDVVIIEDESGRAQLTAGSNVPIAALCTGVIAAMSGKLTGKGQFEVTDWFTPGMGPQRPLRPVDMSVADGGGHLVAFVSGLSFGKQTEAVSWGVGWVSEFLRGELPEHLALSRRVTRLVIAGDIIAPTDEVLIRDKIKIDNEDHKKVQAAGLVSPMRQADEWISGVAQSIPVDLMPGTCDPTNVFLPHQALHPCLLPKAKATGNVGFVTSPHRFAANDGIDVVGTCGDAVTDMLRYGPETPTDALRLCCESSCIAPTAPDTLACYPFTGEDPLILNDAPHLLFAGNQRTYGSESHCGGDGQVCRLLSVPRFTERPSIVLVDFSSPELEAVCKDVRVRMP